jgi:hypothetical protein
MHLNNEELVDIAEGTRSESSAPHLATCDRCVTQLQELRTMLAALPDRRVPEPSPLYWDHLSSRVRDAVNAESQHPSPRVWVSTRWLSGGVAVAAGLVLAAALNLRTPAPSVLSVPTPFLDAGAPTELLSDVTSGDPSLTVVATLTDQVDLDTAREAGLAPRGSADRAVAHLNDAELRELGRLLQQELTRPGA